MEIILNQDVDKLGKRGSIVKVKEGFARNFLIPKGLAIPVTAANLKKLEQEKQRKILQLEKVKQDCIKLKEQLDAFSLTIAALIKEKEEDKLYAGIGSQDIASALREEGFQLDKSQIILDEPIRALGIYEVSIKLHPEVTAKIKLWVVKK